MNDVVIDIIEPECVVCLENICNDGDVVVCCQCGIEYHETCIRKWYTECLLYDRQATCPHCKHEYTLNCEFCCDCKHSRMILEILNSQKYIKRLEQLKRECFPVCIFIALITFFQVASYEFDLH